MSCRLALVAVLFPATLVAQPPVSFSSFGSGCAATNNGLGMPDVVPQANAASFGNTNNIYPFTTWPIRYQQVFLGSELGGLPVYVALGLRQDDGYAGKEGELIDLEIALGGTTLDDQTLGTTFDANFDTANAPKATVFGRRNFALPMMPATKPTDPTRFFVTIPFDTPWARTLASGENLLIEILVRGNSNNNAFFSYQLDAVQNANTTRLFARYPATTGILGQGYGLVMAFYTPGTFEPLSLQASRPPRLGATFYGSLLHATSNTPGAMILGTSNASSAGLPLPFPLAGAGAPGCSLLASTDVTLPVMANAAGDLAISLAVPNNPFLAGQPLFMQFAMLDPINVLGLVTSNGGTLNFGQ